MRKELRKPSGSREGLRNRSNKHNRIKSLYTGSKDKQAKKGSRLRKGLPQTVEKAVIPQWK
jgi:hypothetical protein